MRGLKFFRVKGRFNEKGQFTNLLPLKNLPSGIIAFTLYGSNDTPVAERLHFRWDEKNMLSLKAKPSKEIFSKREKMNIPITVGNASSDTITSSLSVIILDESQYNMLQEKGQTILTHFMLSAELRGKVEQPASYFKDGKVLAQEMDNLLLIQGYRNYLFTDDGIDSIAILPEQSIALSGKVSSFFSKKGKKNLSLTMMTFGENKEVYMQETITMGRFNFQLSNKIGARVNAVIQTSNANNKKRNLEVELDAFTMPDVAYDHTTLLVKPSIVDNSYRQATHENNARVESYNLEHGVNQLDEVLIQGLKDTPGRKKTLEEYGEADIIIRGDEIRAKEKKWSYGLFSVLLFNFPEQLRINRKTLSAPRGSAMQTNMGSYLAAQVGVDTTLIVIDGIPVNEFDLG
ncbi:MAG: hypothetical protein CL868_10430 [Cytophagaceae bacterium]|nr:hypothetical protein [Cytophagaceae bacterium]|tara:strand:- start:525 stop:1730 length:1206 start_codon:yes stop_codon:yes gene_type:complete